MVEHHLADAQRLRRHFQQLVLVQVLDGLVERQDARRRQGLDDSRRLGPVAGQVLGAADVDDQVFVTDVFANHLPGVDLVDGRPHKERPRAVRCSSA